MLSPLIVLAALLPLSGFARSFFNEVNEVLFNPSPAVTTHTAAEELLVYQHGQLPRYKLTVESFFAGSVNLLAQAAKRTINERNDYYPRIQKLLHPNGICLTGVWEANGDSAYTGYFAKGSRGLLLVRVSTAASGTRRGEKRGFGIVGKIFPTMDPNQVVDPAHFFTVDVLTGTNRESVLGVTTTNNPSLGIPGLDMIDIILKLNDALGKADKDLLYRPVYEIAEAGLKDRSQARGPKFIKIHAQGVYNDASDFREELNMDYHPGGLTFIVSGSDSTKNPHDRGWKELAKLKLTKSIVSYGCDRQIHFAHPKSR